MNFNYEYDNKINKGYVINRKNEQSFDYEEGNNGDITIQFGYIQLAINSLTNRVESFWGISPSKNWIKAKLLSPNFMLGIVKCFGEFESPLSYRYPEFDDWKVFFDQKTGWICVGDKEIKDISILISENLGLVLKANQIKAIWVKPKYI